MQKPKRRQRGWAFAGYSSQLDFREAHDDVDVRDLHAFRRFGQAFDRNRVAGNIHQLAIGFEQEVIVIGDVGVEVGFRAFDRQLAQ